MTIDVDALVNTNVSEKLDTTYPIPPAGEYVASISDKGPVKDWFRTVKRKDGTETATLNVLFVISDPAVKALLNGRDPTSRLTIWLDTEIDEMTKATKLSTGKGKNVSLGQLREALGQDNDPEWNFSKLIAAGPVKIMTENSTNNGREYSNVTRVSKL